MRQVTFHYHLSIGALTTALLVSACGGGGATPPGTVSGSSGFAIDDYLSGATVLCDSNNNVAPDGGEATKTTDSSGFFKFDVACGAPMVVTGGTNVDTGLPFTGTLRAPQGSTVITPLTTLVAAGMSVAQVNIALGLPAGTDLLNTDPARRLAGALVNGELMKKSLALQQLVQKITELLAGLSGASGDAARPVIYGEVVSAIAAALQNGGTLSTGTMLDQTVIASLVRVATQRVAVSAVLGTEINSAASGVNADSLAQVVAGGLKLQAEAILAAADADVTAVTRTAQLDTQISTFVQTNRAQLVSAPSATTATLGMTLTGQVTDSLVGGTPPPPPPPPPPPSGTVLVSFDEVNPAFTGMGAYGGALPTVEAGPSGGSGNALRILKPVAPDTWGGVFFNVAAIPFAADRKTITARVNATRAGAIIKFKVESGNGGPAIEVASTPTGAANTWQTLTWNLVGVDISKSYTVIAITPDQDLITTGQSYYIDDITLAAATGGGGGGGSNIVFDPNAAMGSNGPQSITVASADIKTPNGGLTFFVSGEAVFAADYLGSAEAFSPFNLAAYPAARTVSYPGVGNVANGSIGHYQDDVTLSNSANKIEEGGYVVGSILDGNGAPNFFRYFIMKGPAVPNSYMGLFVNAPNNGTVDISAFSRIKFRLWGPRSMYELSFHPQGLEVILAGPKVNGCNTGSGGTEIVQTFNATQTIGAASQYKLPLSGFTVKGLCAGDTNATAVASVLSHLARVVVNVPGTAFNFTLAELNTNPALYAIGLNLGAIGFTNVP